MVHRLNVRAPRPRILLIALAAAAVIFLLVSLLVSRFGQHDAQTQASQAVGQRDATAAQAADLARLIQQACDSGTIPAAYSAACTKAAQVQAAPIPGPAGPQGPQGAAGVQGPAGRGIVATEIQAGDLVVVYSDGSRVDVGQVVGADGTPGVAGAPGAAGAAGPAGATGPPGPAGADGSPASSYTVMYPDGSTQTCTRSGGSDSTPAYTCSAPTTPAPTSRGNGNG